MTWFNWFDDLKAAVDAGGSPVPIRPGGLFDLLPDGSEASIDEARGKVQGAADYVRQAIAEDVAEDVAEVAGGGGREGGEAG